jgi:alpha-N-acetylglucosamine transferase
MALRIISAIWGNKYSEDYVVALKRQVPDLTVLRVGNGLFEPNRYTGWWCKLEVFRPENEHLRPCLFIDLDTYVFGQLDPFFELDLTKLWLIRQFKDLRSPSTKKRSNSGLFIAPKNTDAIWEQAQYFNLDHGNRGRGDGDFLATFPHEIIQHHVSGIMHYKCDRLEKKKPDCRIICFSGHPRPHETEGWAKDYWISMTQ